MKTIQKLTAAILLTASCAGMSVSCVPRSETKNLKIICYNILYGMRRDTTQGKRLFAEWVRQQNPDILALQEVNDFTQFTLETLAAEYGHDYAVARHSMLVPYLGPCKLFGIIHFITYCKRGASAPLYSSSSSSNISFRFSSRSMSRPFVSS